MPERGESDVLSLLIKQYEDKYFVMDAPTTPKAIRCKIEQQGLTNSDLANRMIVYTINNIIIARILLSLAN